MYFLQISIQRTFSNFCHIATTSITIVYWVFDGIEQHEVPHTYNFKFKKFFIATIGELNVVTHISSNFFRVIVGSNDGWQERSP